MVFLPCGYTQICGIDEATGEQLWIKDLKARNRSSPLFYNGLAYVGIGNKIYGFDKNGNTVIEKTYDQVMFFGHPIVSNGYIYFLGVSNTDKDKNEMFVYEMTFDGLIKFNKKYNIGSGSLISCDSSGLVGNGKGLIFVGGSNEKLYCIDTIQQKIKWEAKGTGVMSRSKAFVHGDAVFIGSLTGNIMKVNIETGKVIFDKHLNNEGVWSPPFVYNNHLMVHCGIYAYVLNIETGECLNKLALGFSPYTSFKKINEKLFISAGDPPDYNILYCLRMANDQRVSVSDLVLNYELNNNQSFDHLDFTFKIETANGIEPEDVKVDLSIWGGGEQFKPTKLKSKTYKISMDVPKFFRYGNYSLLLSSRVGNGEFVTTLPICLKEETKPDIPEKYLLSDFKLKTQKKEHYSGPAIMESIENYYGKNVTQQDVNQMGEYIDNIGVHSHHKWRTGAIRMLHSSDNSLKDSDQDSLKSKARFN